MDAVYLSVRDVLTGLVYHFTLLKLPHALSNVHTGIYVIEVCAICCQYYTVWSHQLDVFIVQYYDVCIKFLS